MVDQKKVDQKKRVLYKLARSLLSWDGFKFPPLSLCDYCFIPFHSVESLSFYIGDRFVTFSIRDGFRIRCVEENDGFIIRYEGTLQKGWTFSHRYDIP